MPPKRKVKSATGPEPEPESEFVRAIPEPAMQVVAAEMGERRATLERPTIYGSDKNPPDKEELKEILAGIHEKHSIPGDKNNGYLEYIKGAFNYNERKKRTEIEKEILYTTQIDSYLYNLSPDKLEQFRLHGPEGDLDPELRTFLSPGDYNQKKQVEKAKKQGSESIKASLKRKRKHKKRRKSKKRKSKKKKRKTKRKK